MEILIPTVTFVVGIVLGFLVGVYYLKKQMMNMSMDNEQLKQMTKKMGYNLNQKQLQQMNKMMKGMNKK